jgi:hypothetical protein
MGSLNLPKCIKWKKEKNLVGKFLLNYFFFLLFLILKKKILKGNKIILFFFNFSHKTTHKKLVLLTIYPLLGLSKHCDLGYLTRFFN